jgi:hypothetical protein
MPTAAKASAATPTRNDEQRNASESPIPAHSEAARK